VATRKIEERAAARGLAKSALVAQLLLEHFEKDQS
jgi:hypothetical protein